MSKKIDRALKELKKALEAHADVVGGSAVSLKKAQRASAKVAATASAYAEAVHSKSGLASPFTNLSNPGLDESTVASLEAERDAIKDRVTGPIPVQAASDDDPGADYETGDEEDDDDDDDDDEDHDDDAHESHDSSHEHGSDEHGSDEHGSDDHASHDHRPDEAQHDEGDHDENRH